MNEERLKELEALANDCGLLTHPDISELIAEVRRLREALEFYADETNYEMVIDRQGLAFFTVEIDEGQYARDSLKGE